MEDSKDKTPEPTRESPNSETKQKNTSPSSSQPQSEKPSLVTLQNDSSTSSSPVNFEVHEINFNNRNGNTDNNNNTYDKNIFQRVNEESFTPTTQLQSSNRPLYEKNYNRRVSSRDTPTSFTSSKRPSSVGVRRTLLTGPILYNSNNLYGNEIADGTVSDQLANTGICLDCGIKSYLTRVCDIQLCENCAAKRWQNEVNELVKIKTFLENSVEDLKKYLAAKKSQCNENIRNSQQIKRFINMTMQQIKRKIELELENKRDELYHSIDVFVENQKK
jgi:hypothetical protein